MSWLACKVNSCYNYQDILNFEKEGEGRRRKEEEEEGKEDKREGEEDCLSF